MANVVNTDRLRDGRIKLNSLCRLCMSLRKPFFNIFRSKNFYGVVVAELIKEILEIEESENDLYPDVVCEICLHKLVEFKEFKELCLETRSRFDDGFLSTENLKDATTNEESKEDIMSRESTQGLIKSEPIEELEIDNNDEEDNDECVLRSEITIDNYDPWCNRNSERMKREDDSEAVLGDNTLYQTDDDYRINNECSVLRADDDFIGNEDILCASTSVNLEKFNEPEESFSMQKRNEDVNLKRHLQGGKNREQVDIKGSNDTTMKYSLRNSTRKKSCESISVKSVAKKRQKQDSKKKRYVCDICGKVASTKHLMSIHIKVHSGGRLHKCKICNKTFSHGYVLNRHKNIHSGVRSFKCKSCSKTFTQHSTLFNHEKRHLGARNYPCDQCLKRFVTKGDLKTHQLYHKNDRRFFCSECGRAFFTHSNLVNHERIHSGIKPFKCHNCNASFTQSGQLKVHSVIHMEVKPFTCSLCKRYFRYSSELKNHKCFGNKEFEYSCSRCSFKSTGIKSLRSHEIHCKKR